MHDQTALAGFEIQITPFPDETIFSWCSRYHRLAASAFDRVTALHLFGTAQTAITHDFTAHLDTLATRANGVLGSSLEIVQQRTLLPFYLPFKPARIGLEAISAMQGYGIAHMKYRLGLLTSGLGAAHPLKFCPHCMQEDQRQNGWSFWRRSQQLPGVWLCRKHLQTLQVSSQKGRAGWLLPSEDHCQTVPILQGLSLSSQDWLLKLDCMSSEVILYPPGSLDDPVRIGDIFRRRLDELGLTKASGRLRKSSLDPKLGELSRHLSYLPELAHQSDPRLLHSQLLRLLSGRSLTHPLRYLVWITTWFNSFDEFLQAYRVEAKKSAAVRVTPDAELTSRIGLSRSQKYFLEKALQGSISLSAAAKAANVDYTTMAHWASKQAHEPKRRPKTLIQPCLHEAITRLTEGQDKKRVALALGISTVSVTRILRTVPNLQAQWHAVRHEQRRAQARDSWSQVVGLQAFLGIKGLRCLQPAAYAWLYRNDRMWLIASTQSIGKRKGSNHASVRIENSDARIATTLRNLACKFPAIKKWSQDEISRSIPKINQVLHSPEQWPETIKALNSLLNADLAEREKFI